MKDEWAARIQARTSAITLLSDGAFFPGCTDRPLPAVIVRSLRELSSKGIGRISLRIGKQPRIVKVDAGEPA